MWPCDVLRDERVDLLLAQPAFDQVAVSDRLACPLEVADRALPHHQLAVVVGCVGKMAEGLAREALSEVAENKADHRLAGVLELFLVAVQEPDARSRPGALHRPILSVDGEDFAQHLPLIGSVAELTAGILLE